MHVILTFLLNTTTTCLSSAFSAARVRSSANQKNITSYSAWVVYNSLVSILNFQICLNFFLSTLIHSRSLTHLFFPIHSAPCHPTSFPSPPCSICPSPTHNPQWQDCHPMVVTLCVIQQITTNVNIHTAECFRTASTVGASVPYVIDLLRQSKAASVTFYASYTQTVMVVCASVVTLEDPHFLLMQCLSAARTMSYHRLKASLLLLTYQVLNCFI